jgi:hypothetical protein
MKFEYPLAYLAPGPCFEQVQFISHPATNDGMVRMWLRMFNEGRENVHDEAENGRPSLVIGDLVRKFNERLRDNRHNF